MAAAYARVGPVARRSASASTSSANESSDTRTSTRPHALACAAGTRSPSSAIVEARPAPARAGTKMDDPPSGTRPMLTNASSRYADSVASTRSQASASEQPIPTAGPLTAATTGFGMRRTPVMIGW